MPRKKGISYTIECRKKRQSIQTASIHLPVLLFLSFNQPKIIDKYFHPNYSVILTERRVGRVLHTPLGNVLGRLWVALWMRLRRIVRRSYYVSNRSKRFPTQPCSEWWIGRGTRLAPLKASLRNKRRFFVDIISY